MITVDIQIVGQHSTSSGAPVKKNWGPKPEPYPEQQFPYPEGWMPYPEHSLKPRPTLTTTTTTTIVPTTAPPTTAVPTSRIPTTPVPTSRIPTTPGCPDPNEINCDTLISCICPSTNIDPIYIAAIGDICSNISPQNPLYYTCTDFLVNNCKNYAYVNFPLFSNQRTSCDILLDLLISIANNCNCDSPFTCLCPNSTITPSVNSLCLNPQYDPCNDLKGGNCTADQISNLVSICSNFNAGDAMGGVN